MSPFIVLAALTGSLVSVRVDTAPAHRLNTIRPIRAIGTSVDSDPPGKIALLYSRPRTRQMLEAGLGALSYRLYTELSIEDWHWNPTGRYSEAARLEGYWTSSSASSRPPISDSFGYRLPRRGSTRDQGDDGDYSRLDDGDATTYWKSDPYLTSSFTNEADELHPQWAVIDLERPRAVDAIRIAWMNPYATRYDVQYWTGGDAILDQAHGTWHTFPSGMVANGKGGEALVRLARVPATARFFRVLMRTSSGTCDKRDAADRRNCVGYAIAELGLGRVDALGRFRDVIQHSPCGGNPAGERRCAPHQTIIFVSSVDPWHRARDRVRSDQDQPGLDLIARNPITRGLPVMYPVPMLYSTPENAVAEVRYLEARGYPISYVELGEEADGQYVTPEDYGALYLQWAETLHALDPRLRLGGPVFQGVNSDVTVWRDANGDVSWLHRFLHYLKRHERLGELAFMSFEHYPYMTCEQGVKLDRDLLREPALVRRIVATWRADGLPKDVPLFITESNFASETSPVPQQLEGALWLADYVASALSAGVSGITHYQYEAEPLSPNRTCRRWGAYGMFVTDRNFRIRAKAAQFYGAQMLTLHWLEPGDAEHELYPVQTNPRSDAPPVSAYAAKRPDGSWSVLFVNKDRTPHRIDVTFAGNGVTTQRFTGQVNLVTFGERQYRWEGRTQNDIPAPRDPPASSSVDGEPATTYAIPARSITVLRGRLARSDGTASVRALVRPGSVESPARREWSRPEASGAALRAMN